MNGQPAKTPSHGLGLIFGGGVGLVFGAAFKNPGLGLVYGAGLGLVLVTVLCARGSKGQVD